MQATTTKLLQYVRDNPGVTGSAIQEHFRSEIPKNTISNTLGRFRRMGLIENRGAGGPWSEWYPVEFEPVDPVFKTMAKTVIAELKDILPAEREDYLARRIEELFMEELSA